MQELKEIRDWAISLLEDETQNTEIDLWINNSVRQAEKLTRWERLRGFVDLTTDANGDITLPAYVRTPNVIFPGDGTHPNASLPFVRRIRIPNDFETRVKQRYYVPRGMSQVARSQPLCDVTYRSTSIDIRVAAGTWFVAGDVGKACTFDGTSHPYEITAVDTVAETASIFPSYRGQTEVTNGVLATTPPEGERIIRFYNEDDTVYASAAVRIDFQRFHPRLYGDRDLFLLDCPTCIRLLVQQEMLRNGKYDRDALNLLQELEAAKHMEVAPENQEERANLPQGIGKMGPLFGRGPRRNQPGFRAV
jgi:hypothetical protein